MGGQDRKARNAETDRQGVMITDRLIINLIGGSPRRSDDQRRNEEARRPAGSQGRGSARSGSALAEHRPGLHQGNPAVEKIGSGVRRLHLVTNRVCKGHLADLTRETLPGPVPKCAAESMHREVAPAHAAQDGSQGHV